MAVINLGIAPISAADSITAVGNVIRLVNDSAAPGASKVYATDSGGTRGWLTIATALGNALIDINSITSQAGQSLVLAVGTGGTVLTLATSTLAATFGGTITAATSVTVAAGSGGQLILNRTTATAQSWAITGGTNWTLSDITAGTTPITVAVTTGNVTLNGNLVVSGTGTNTFAGPIALTPVTANVSAGITITDSAGKILQLTPSFGSNGLPGIGTGSDDDLTFRVNGAEKMRLTKTNFNLLIGGTTDISGAGGLKVFGTTAATTTTSGALIVAGGVGVAKAIFAGELISAGTALLAGGATDVGSNRVLQVGTSSLTTLYNRFQVKTAGSVFSEFLAAGFDTLYVGINNTGGTVVGMPTGCAGMSSTASTTPLVFGVGTVEKLRVANTVITIAPTTASTTPSTGALVVSGGVGIGTATGTVNSLVWGFSGTSDYRSALGNTSNGTPFMAFHAIAGTTTTFTTTVAAGSILRGDDAGGFVFATLAAAQTNVEPTTLGTISAAGNWAMTGDLTVTGGNVGVGTAAAADRALYIASSALTGTTQYGTVSQPVLNGATTLGAAGVFNIVTSTSFTMVAGYGLLIATPTIAHASATVTSAFGIYVDNQGVSGKTTNAYGIDIAAQSGAATVNVGLRNAGTTLLTNATAASSTTAAALVVTGGIATGGSIVAGNVLTLGYTSSTDATLLRFTTPSGTTNNYVNWGEVSIGGQTLDLAFLRWTRDASQGRKLGVYISTNGGVSTLALSTDYVGNVLVPLNTVANSTTSGALQVAGGGSFVGAVYVGGNTVSTGGVGWGVTSTSTANGTTAISSTSTVCQIFTGTAGQTVTLPGASSLGAGVALVYVFINRSTQTIVLTRADSDTIEGSATYPLAAGNRVMLVSNSSSTWSIV